MLLSLSVLFYSLFFPFLYFISFILSDTINKFFKEKEYGNNLDHLLRHQRGKNRDKKQRSSKLRTLDVVNNRLVIRFQQIRQASVVAESSLYTTWRFTTWSMSCMEHAESLLVHPVTFSCPGALLLDPWVCNSLPLTYTHCPSISPIMISGNALDSLFILKLSWSCSWETSQGRLKLSINRI